MSFPRVERSCEHTFLTSVLKRDSVVIDFGANHGDFAHGIIRKFGCEVYAAEPVSSLFKEIERHPRLHLLRVAIGGTNEPVTIKIHHTRCASVLSEVANEGPAIEETVEGVTFSEFLKRAKVDKVDLAKIDIEGAEIPMFAAASDSDLLRVAQYTIEFHDFIYPELAATVEDIKRRFRGLGFWSINMSLDNQDVLFLNPLRLHLNQSDQLYLRSIVKYGRGVRRSLQRWGGRLRAADAQGV